MSHDIENRAGRDAMAFNSQRGLPWHGLGTPLDGDATAKEMLVAADCDWTVEKRPVYVKREVLTVEGVTTSFVAVEDQYETVRSDDEKTLGIVGSVYEDFSNAQLLDFGQDILDQARGASGLGARWDTMMSLKGGRLVVANLVLPKYFTVLGDDAHDLNLGVFTSHDGSSSLGADISAIRRVCMNTHQFAQAAAKTSVKIRHTETMVERSKNAAKALSLAFDYADAYKAMAESFAAQEMRSPEIAQFLEALVPVTAKTSGGQERTLEFRKTIGKNIVQSATISDDLRFTKWGVYQSVGEFADHLLAIRPDSRVVAAEQKFFAQQKGGVAYNLKAKAMDLLKV